VKEKLALSMEDQNLAMTQMLESFVAHSNKPTKHRQTQRSSRTNQTLIAKQTICTSKNGTKVCSTDAAGKTGSKAIRDFLLANS